MDKEHCTRKEVDMKQVELRQWIETDRLYKRSLRVIDSCGTLVQLDTAIRYVELAVKRMHRLLGPSLLTLILGAINFKRGMINGEYVYGWVDPRIALGHLLKDGR